MHDELLSPLDHATVRLLQEVPRISWAEASNRLSTNSASLSARWAALRKAGSSWLTLQPNIKDGRLIVAFVELVCREGAAQQVANDLALDGRVVSIEEGSSQRDLLLTLIARSYAELSSFVLNGILSRNDISSQQTHLATRIYSDGSDWRTSTSSSGGVARDISNSKSLSFIRSNFQDELQRNIICLLQADGRMASSEIARRIGIDQSTAFRRVRAISSSGDWIFRCDVCQEDAGLPISCTFFLRVSAQNRAEVIERVIRLRNLRLCAAITGTSNVLVTIWLRSPRDILTLEMEFENMTNWLAVQNISLTLRSRKRMGWVLDNNGRAVRNVPVLSDVGDGRASAKPQ